MKEYDATAISQCLKPTNKVEIREIYIEQSGFLQLCKAAGVPPNQKNYSAAECKKVSDTLKSDLTIMAELASARRDELRYFLDNCDGMTVTFDTEIKRANPE